MSRLHTGGMVLGRAVHVMGYSAYQACDECGETKHVEDMDLVCDGCKASYAKLREERGEMLEMLKEWVEKEMDCHCNQRGLCMTCETEKLIAKAEGE